MSAEQPATQRAAAGEPGDQDADLLPEELELAGLDRTRPTAHQLAGGAPRDLAWLLVIGGAIGTWASVMLVLSERTLLTDPDASLGCDINPIVGCGGFLLSPQSAVLGVPNALLGTIAFTIVAVTGLVLLGGGLLPRAYWVAFVAGSVLAAVSITWFQYEALVTLRGLCVYCLVVWTVTIPIVVNVVARGLQAGHLPAPDRLRRGFLQERGLVTAAWYVVLAVLIVVAFWEQWALML